MSGHNKWSTIKHKKGKEDAKRGKIFTKLIREITVAARAGGGDADGNPRLRSAIQTARGANMPQDNIIRAIKKGTGELEGTTYEEITYEGYGPGGAAVICDILTDNKKRTVAEIRHIFSKNNGNMGETGCVSWKFDLKGFINVDRKTADGAEIDEDELMMVVLDAGAEDLKTEEGSFEVYTEPGDMETVRTAIEEAGFPVLSAETAKIPQTTTEVEGKAAVQLLRLVDALEDCDDIQKVWADFDIDDSVYDEL